MQYKDLMFYYTMVARIPSIVRGVTFSGLVGEVGNSLVMKAGVNGLASQYWLNGTRPPRPLLCD